MAIDITAARYLPDSPPDSGDAKPRTTDRVLFVTVLALLSLGVVMVFDASYPLAIEVHRDAFFWAKKQFLFAAIGFWGMFAASRLPFPYLRRLGAPFFVLCFVGLCALPHFGHTSGGATRWLKLGGYQVQPSEFMKLAMVMMLAQVLTARPRLLQRTIFGLIPLLSLVAVVFILIEKEPDLGTAMVVLIGALVMFIVGGVRLRVLAALLAVSLVGASFYFAFSKSGHFRWQRVTTFLSEDADVTAEAFQIYRSKIALGTGGVFGLGMGESREKLRGGVPAQRTDFIYAIIGEEFGLIGSLTVAGLYLVLCARGLQIAFKSKSRYGSLLAVGITTYICGQAVLNMAVATATVPTTGVPLPLVSYGGSSLVPILFALGILLNISSNPDYRDPRPSNRATRQLPVASEALDA